MLNKKLYEALRTTVDEIIKKDQDKIEENQQVNEHNVFQPARKTNREIVFNLLKMCVKPDSGIIGLENWDQFIKNYENGQSSLIFAEHKSNLDVIIFNYLMNKAGDFYAKTFDEIVFIAGRRLNEDSVTVKLFAEMYTRLIVVAKTEASDEVSQEEQEQMYKINYATQTYLKNNINNHIYFLYPTGTRARVWDLSTYDVLTEAINYLRKFDQVIFMSVDGNCMFPLPNVGMDSEPVIEDTITLRFSKPHNVKELLNESQKEFEKLSSQEKEKYANNLKIYLSQVIKDYIYNQKPCLPWQEPWVKIYEKIVDYLNKKNQF